jgi:rhodanese-related sulfurtransferase
MKFPQNNQMNIFGITGQDEKKFGTITSEELENILENKDHAGSFRVIDVRNPDEYGQGHIAGAILLSITDPAFKNKIEELDPDLTYYVYCRSGGRSQKACSYMIQVGFEKVFNLKNGILDWSGPEDE